MFQRFKYFIPAYLFAGLIFFESSISTAGIKKVQRMHRLLDISLSDYSLHFFGFGILAIMLAWGYYKSKSSFTLVKAGVIACLFGMLIEVYQSFLPYREVSYVDMGINLAGIVLALLVFWYAIQKKHLFGL
jgi:VanZ family protein